MLRIVEEVSPLSFQFDAASGNVLGDFGGGALPVATPEPSTTPAPTEPPVTEPPVTEPPVTQPPVTQPPVTQPPVTQPPVTQPPVTQPPVTQPPVTQPPVTEPPVTQPPVTQPPGTEPPGTEPPLPPTLAVNDVTVHENAGVAVFTVTLSAASGQTVTVAYNTGDASAHQPGDYTTTGGTLTFAPGTTAQTVTVPITNDTVAEPTETFNVVLSTPANA
ncbi:MAG: hypothetical protein HY777_03825, partial [Betaproteobacteria bacterium]|nr:hypothetical protein [Betaproteobacteria bacterium]